MKLIKITTDNEISVHVFPKGSYSEQNQVLRGLIGPRCELYEHVMPKRLYTELGASNEASRKKGRCASMLIDEEGWYHNLASNAVGSFLYETDKHGRLIVGNILFVGEVLGGEGINFCGIADDQFALLFPQLKKLTEKARDFK